MLLRSTGQISAEQELFTCDYFFVFIEYPIALSALKMWVAEFAKIQSVPLIV